MVTKKKARKPARAERPSKQPTSKATPGPFAGLKLPQLGAPCAGQGGSFSGVIRSEDGKQAFAEFVIDPKHWLTAAWGPLERVAGAMSQYDGRANTEAMAAAGSEIARKVLAMNVEGHRDIYIAAPREARLAHINGCGPESGWAWTSSQDRDWDNGAWAQDFSDGIQFYYHKSYKLPVVLVRRVPIQ